MQLLQARCLMPVLSTAITCYTKYQSGELKVIGSPGYSSTDIIVSEFMSYSEWIASHHIYPIIKVEGLESNLNIKADTIHLFYNQKSRYSFNWHTDLVNVRLHVVKGRKVLKVKDKTHTLYPGQTAFIPKGHLHRAYSDAGTWALSISD